MALNLALLLTESCARRPGATAFACNGQRLTYGALHAASNKVTNALRSLGLQPGDRIAMAMPNALPFPVVYFGILKLGATVVPLDPGLARADHQACLRDCRAAALFTWQEAATEPWQRDDLPDLRHIIAVNGADALPEGALSFSALLAVGSSSFDLVWTMPDDAAVIQHRPPAGGSPRGAVLTHATMLCSAVTLADRILHVDSSTVGLAALPLSGSFGQTSAMNALLYAGATVLLPASCGSAGVLRGIEHDAPTLLVSTPQQISDLLEAAAHGPSGRWDLTLCASLGGPLAPEQRERFEQRFGAHLLEGYGLAEAPVATFNTLDAARPGSFGRALWGVEVGIFGAEGKRLPPQSTGEICVRGHCVMQGYTGQPEATATALHHGWLHTGDAGRMDSDGYLYPAGTG